MKREFLSGLGIDAGLIDQIMTENGKDIEGLKAQLGVQKGLVTDLTGKLTTATNELGELKKIDVQAITSERDTYKNQYQQAVKDKDAAVAAVKYDAALDSALSGCKFTSTFARDGVRSMLAEKKLKLGTDGKFEGFDDALKGIRESTPDAFVATETKPTPQFSSTVRGSSDSLTETEYLNSRYKDNPYYKG